MAAKYNSTWGFNIPNDGLPDSVEVWIDCFDGLHDSKSKIKIFVSIEPNEIINLNNELLNRKNEFNYILTYDDDVLNKINNGILFEYGTTWIDIKEYTYPSKSFSVSTICGHKELTQNHILRKELWYNQTKIMIPKNFYMSRFGGVQPIDNNPILYESKFPLFDSMFHICIENVTRNNFFTEKIIDSFLCKTIPIYIGCPNIDKYFDVSGILIAKSPKDIIDICNNLTPDYYYSHLKSIEYNYNIAKDWIDYNYRLKNKIKNILNL